MSSEGVVEGWARWSREKCEEWAREAGPRVTVHHDAALQRTSERLRRIGVASPDSTLLLGMIFAFEFLSGDTDVDPVARNHLLRKLALQIGLAAEAADNRGLDEEFEAIVGERGGIAEGVIEKTETCEGSAMPETGVYSCNARREVWRSTAKGWNREETRVYLQGINPALDATVTKVLAVSPMGGRFVVTEDGVFLARDLSQVA